MHCSLQIFIKRFFALMLALALLLCCVPTVYAADASGDCGRGVKWSLNGGVLTLSGKGIMDDYTEARPAPWNAYAEVIRAVIVEKGVENIGSFAFCMLTNLASVTMADSVSRIGGWAFYGCENLGLLDLGEGLQEIGRSAFERCYALTGLRLPASLRALRYHAFYRCESLMSITVPAGVVDFESAVFAHCTGLQYVKILANITELPRWTFYGCKSLATVSLTSAIKQTGANAFHDCDKLKDPVYNAVEGDVTVSNSSATQTETGSVTVKDTYTQTENSTITSQVTTTQNGTEKDTQVQMDAVLENENGWSDLADLVIQLPGKAENVQVHVHLKGEPTVSGENLKKMAQEDVMLSIHTSQGAVWHIQTGNLQNVDLQKSYDLKFTLRPLTELSEVQAAAVGDAKSYTVVFNRTLDFKVAVELPLGKELSLRTAAFFAPEDSEFVRKQTVRIDNQGVAHFYLGYVDKGVEYLIGIDVPAKSEDVSTSVEIVLPDTMKNDHPDFVMSSDIEYIITGAKSSWGLSFGQVTGIMIAVLAACAAIVGVVMFTLNKRRLKAGYIPQIDGEEEE